MPSNTPSLPRREFLKKSTFGLAGLALASRELFAQDTTQPRPNILWLVTEDADIKWFGCYGSGQATTPNIDRMAAEGFRYVNAFANAPVCAPSRSGWITGVYALSTGTHPMRSRYNIPHDLISYYPDQLRQAGYYCTNHTKTDYNIGGRPDTACWNGAEEYGWNRRQPGQPFFSVINYNESHESRAFGPVDNTRHDPSKVVLEAFHPDLPEIRKNYALYEDAVQNADARVGMALDALKKAGLEDDTIVIFCTDHGGVMPRSKRFIYETGIHTPLIIRIPEKFKSLWPAEKPGMPVDRLVSYIDMPKTWLSIAQATPPATMQGRIFLGLQAEPEPEYSFAYRGRMDERYDECRAARDKRFLYIKNYMPYAKWGQHLSYLWQMVAVQSWESFFKEGKSNDVNGLFFKTKPWVEELYDCEKDPDNVNNLSTNPAYAPVVERMRKALTDWQLAIHDSGLLPETEMTRRAAAHQTTIYQMVRDPKLYNLPGYLAAADTALAKSAANETTLTGYLGDADSGIRYWGASGLVMGANVSANAVNALKTCLNDESHDVRAMAAWALIKAGSVAEGQNCLIDLLNQGSHATLKVMNVIDWMDVDTTPYLPAVRAVKAGGAKGDNYLKEMQDYLLDPNKRSRVGVSDEKRDAEKIKKERHEA